MSLGAVDTASLVFIRFPPFYVALFRVTAQRRRGLTGRLAGQKLSRCGAMWQCTGACCGSVTGFGYARDGDGK